MDLKPGSRWKSAVCAAEVIVVRATKAPAELACGGHPMTATGATAIWTATASSTSSREGQFRPQRIRRVR